MIVQIVILIGSIIALWLGALWIVEGAVHLARRLGLSELVIGLTIVAVGTSLPELAVSVDAAFEGAPDIALGNVIGSNIFNLGLILGSVVLFHSIRTSQRLVLRDGLMLFGATLLLAIFLVDLHLARWEGGILLAMLVAYLLYLGIDREGPTEDTPEGSFTWQDVPRLIIGLGIVLIGAHFLVESASILARAAGVSEWLIGVTIVALGTSTPEIATSLAGLLRGSHSISVGNLIGSDLFNILGALGLAASVSPFAISTAAQQSLLPMVGMSALLVILMRSGWQLTRWKGGLLVLSGLMRWGINIGG
ncbi:sodium:calcium antiporter [Chloroflexi bacterium TSY]|nr:sodium:calcium antiporter [Chloroflexi bacterium TSY]